MPAQPEVLRTSPNVRTPRPNSRRNRETALTFEIRGHFCMDELIRRGLARSASCASLVEIERAMYTKFAIESRSHTSGPATNNLFGTNFAEAKVW